MPVSPASGKARCKPASNIDQISALTGVQHRPGEFPEPPNSSSKIRRFSLVNFGRRDLVNLARRFTGFGDSTRFIDGSWTFTVHGHKWLLRSTAHGMNSGASSILPGIETLIGLEYSYFACRTT